MYLFISRTAYFFKCLSLFQDVFLKEGRGILLSFESPYNWDRNRGYKLSEGMGKCMQKYKGTQI